jgi:hypothetical protein
MLVEQVEALKSIQEAYVAMNSEQLDEGFAHPNHKKLDANGNGKVDANDFELLRKKKGIKNFKEFKESLEQLDELSKKTLGSYAKKASAEANFASKLAGSASAGEYSKDNIDKENKYSDHAMKRRKGIDKAINKLTKEDIDALGLDLNELLESDDTYKKSDGKQPSYVVSVLKNGDLQFTSHLEDGSNFTISHSKNTDGIPFEQPLDLKKVTDLANSQLKSNKKYSAIRSTKGTSSVKDVYLVDTTKTDIIFYI